MGGFASNGFGEHSPGHYGVGAAFAMELVMTWVAPIAGGILGAVAYRALRPDAAAQEG